MDRIINGVDSFMENAANTMNGLVGRVSPEETLIRRAIARDNYNLMLERERISNEIDRLGGKINNDKKMARFSEKKKEEDFYIKKVRDAERERMSLEILLTQLQNQRRRRFDEEKDG